MQERVERETGAAPSVQTSGPDQPPAFSFRQSMIGLGKLVLTLLLAGVGGWIMSVLHMPLPWLLGAMTATAVAALLRLPVSVPPRIRPPMTAAIGVMLGTSFHPGIFAHAGEWVVPLVGMVLFIFTAGLASYSYFRIVAGFDHPTAYFAGMPGGVVEMVILGSERGGDERMIALVHSARIFLVVFSLPFLLRQFTGLPIGSAIRTIVPISSIGLDDLGWFVAAVVVGCGAGILLRMPARFLLGPMTASGVLHYAGISDFVLPTVVLAFVQVVIGASIGARFAKVSPALVLKVLGLSVGSTALLLSLTFSFAWAVSRLSALPMEGVILAYSPGGLAEMSLVALALHIEVPFVIFHHVVRVLLVVAVATGLFRLLPGWRP